MITMHFGDELILVSLNCPLELQDETAGSNGLDFWGLWDCYAPKDPN